MRRVQHNDMLTSSNIVLRAKLRTLAPLSARQEVNLPVINDKGNQMFLRSSFCFVKCSISFITCCWFSFIFKFVYLLFSFFLFTDIYYQYPLVSDCP